MASGQDGHQEGGTPGVSGLAKPLYLQRLERSLKLDSFLRQTAAIFNRDIRYRKDRILHLQTPGQLFAFSTF